MPDLIGDYVDRPGFASRVRSLMLRMDQAERVGFRRDGQVAVEEAEVGALERLLEAYLAPHQVIVGDIDGKPAKVQMPAQSALLRTDTGGITAPQFPAHSILARTEAPNNGFDDSLLFLSPAAGSVFVRLRGTTGVLNDPMVLGVPYRSFHEDHMAPTGIAWGGTTTLSYDGPYLLYVTGTSASTTTINLPAAGSFNHCHPWTVAKTNGAFIVGSGQGLDVVPASGQRINGATSTFSLSGSGNHGVRITPLANLGSEEFMVEEIHPNQ